MKCMYISAQNMFLFLFQQRQTKFSQKGKRHSECKTSGTKFNEVEKCQTVSEAEFIIVHQAFIGHKIFKIQFAFKIT